MRHSDPARPAAPDATGTDSLDTDNTASVTLQFPANPPTADLLTPVSC
jgi:hypothetical protein